MSGRYKSEREEKLLDDLLTRFQALGIVVWGQIEGAPGTYAKLLVKSDGTVKVEGVVSGSVDISDDWTRQLGQVDIARYLGSAIGVANPLHSQIVVSGAIIDPRSIRSLVKTSDELYSVLRTDAGVAYDARLILGSQSQQIQQKASTYELLVDIVDRAARQLGLVYGSQNQILQQKASTYELLVDTVDRATRLLGIVYGSQSQQIQQTATNYNLQVELASGATLYDARQIRTLISTDIITAYGSLGALQQRATSLDLYAAIRQGGSELSVSNPLFVGVVDASGNRMPSMDTSTRPGYIDLIDRAARLLGIIYGDQGQLAQRATTRDIYVAIRYAGSEIDPRLIQDVQKVVSPTYLVPTALGAGGTATIVAAPGNGYKLRLKGIQISVDAETRIDLRWGTTAWRSYYLPENGSIERNFVSENIEGGDNQALTILSSAEANVTASASTETLAV